MGLVKFLRVKFRRKRHSTDDEISAAAAVAVDTTTTNCKHDDRTQRIVKRLSWDQIQRLITIDSSPIIGYGGFSTVYLAGRFQDFSTTTAAAAVKIQNCTSHRFRQAYKMELEILLRLHHRYIVKLIAYCDHPEEGALVLEYASNGNLQQRLHSSNTSLAWRRRVAIAFQLAQAICYLHDGCSPHIVHGDVKSSNVLLDENLDCKLCDFGSAKVGFSSAIDPPPPAADSNARRPWRSNRTAVVGSPGYTDPAYLRTGLASKKNDVYGFGVVVLELITGVEAFSAARGERLTARAEPMLRDAGKVAEMVDPRLAGGEIDLEEARAMAAMAAKCLSDSPGVRPSASEILTVMRNTIYHL
ncbi:hypothetical protein ABFX02_05G059300 [Erythranthe guttata]